MWIERQPSPTRTRVPFRAWLLVAVVTGLLLSLIGMHQVVAAPADTSPGSSMSHLADGPETDQAPPAEPTPSGQHDSTLLNMCLAVLAALLLVGLSLLVIRWWRGAGPATATAPVQRASAVPRGPPPTVPVRLALLCVLRT